MPGGTESSNKKLEHLDSHGFKKKMVAAPAVNQRFEFIDGREVNTNTEKHPGWYIMPEATDAFNSYVIGWSLYLT